MKTRWLAFTYYATLAALTCALAPTAVQAQVPAAAVHGNGGWFELLPDGVVLDDIRINAWVDADGNVGGNATWVSVLNGYYGPGQGSYEHMWLLEGTPRRAADDAAHTLTSDTMSTPRYPLPYQVNTRVWLTDLSRSLGRRATLDDIPDVELDRLAAMGFDWIWLLSVWQTGLAAQ